MSQMSGNPYTSTFAAAAPQVAAHAVDWERSVFVRRTYLHLFGAIAALVVLETLIFTLVPADVLMNAVGGLLGTQFGWLGVLAAFMAVSWVAERWAMSDASREVQYAGLGLYVVAQALILVPLLLIAQERAPGAIPAAGIVTMMIFGGLTAIVMITGSDLSSWGKYLWWLGMVALAAIVGSIFLGFTLGLFFVVAMIALASGYILYHTSNVMHHYRTDQHVAASLALFASVALLFWYVLQLFLSRD